MPSRENWVEERMVGTAECYEYNDSGSRYWVAACSREQADAIIREFASDELSAGAFKVRTLREADMRTMRMKPAVGEASNLANHFIAYCANYAAAGLLACTED